jgi:hypothetical protein
MSGSKVQLNLLVSDEVARRFREEGKKAGYGQRPAPLLEWILAMYEGNLQLVYRRLCNIKKYQPEVFKGDEQRLFARKLIGLLEELLAD